MKLNSGKLLRSLCLLLLMLLCAGWYTGQASAQCCCGGVHLSLYGEDKKPITPVVTALVSLKDVAQPITPRLIEPKIGQQGEETIRVSADCYGFDLMEITIAHKGERMVLRLRHLQFGELGEIYFEPLAFRQGTSEIDFTGELKPKCKENANDFRCAIPPERWQKISDQPETELTSPPAKSESP